MDRKSHRDGIAARRDCLPFCTFHEEGPMIMFSELASTMLKLELYLYLPQYSNLVFDA